MDVSDFMNAIVYLYICVYLLCNLASYATGLLLYLMMQVTC
jgi:hypothetical protein